MWMCVWLRWNGLRLRGAASTQTSMALCATGIIVIWVHQCYHSTRFSIYHSRTNGGNWKMPVDLSKTFVTQLAWVSDRLSREMVVVFKIADSLRIPHWGPAHSLLLADNSLARHSRQSSASKSQSLFIPLFFRPHLAINRHLNVVSRFSFPFFSPNKYPTDLWHLKRKQFQYSTIYHLIGSYFIANFILLIFMIGFGCSPFRWIVACWCMLVGAVGWTGLFGCHWRFVCLIRFSNNIYLQ